VEPGSASEKSGEQRASTQIKGLDIKGDWGGKKTQLRKRMRGKEVEAKKIGFQE